MNIKYSSDDAIFIAKNFILNEEKKKWIIEPNCFLKLYADGNVINQPKPLFKKSNFYFKSSSNQRDTSIEKDIWIINHYVLKLF
jgi:hypothetical protein